MTTNTSSANAEAMPSLLDLEPAILTIESHAALLRALTQSPADIEAAALAAPAAYVGIAAESLRTMFRALVAAKSEARA